MDDKRPNADSRLQAGGGRRTETRRGVREFLIGAGLPVFLLGAVTVYEAFLLALVFAPEASNGWWAAFARDFRIWCFNYDPRTGGMEWSAVGMMTAEPLFVVIVALVLWRRALHAGAWLRAWRVALAGGTIALLAAGALLTLRADDREAPLPPFPGERIRTAITPPAFTFVDQTGQPCELAELRGRVVLVTGVYALCSTSCPEILIETRKLLDSLRPAARAKLSVVALSLNPEYDTVAMMSAVASGYGFVHPEFRYLNGDAAVMHGVLEDLQFARVRNAQTGVIDHANLLILIDAEGKIAYRFNLNPRHQAWLREAVLQLTAEIDGRDEAAM